MKGEACQEKTIKLDLHLAGLEIIKADHKSWDDVRGNGASKGGSVTLCSILSPAGPFSLPSPAPSLVLRSRWRRYERMAQRGPWSKP